MEWKQVKGNPVHIHQSSKYFEHYSHTFSMLMDMAEMDRHEKDVMDIDKLLRIAKKKYNSLVSSGEWSGSKSKGTRSTFTSQVDNSANTPATGTRKPVCWNCGKVGQTFKNVPSPRTTSELNLIATNDMPRPTQHNLNPIRTLRVIHLLNGAHLRRVKIINASSMENTCSIFTN